MFLLNTTPTTISRNRCWRVDSGMKGKRRGNKPVPSVPYRGDGG